MRAILGALALLGLVVAGSGAALAAPATVNGVASATPTRVTNINGPSNGQQTSFTGYTGGGPYLYTLYPFTVTQTGVYTATSSTVGVVNTTWIVNGIFAPASPAQPTTPLSDFIVAVLSDSGVPPTGTFTGFNLTAGQQYSVLIAYNTGAVAGVTTHSFTMNGPGCINIGANVCAAVPTASEWSMGAIVLGIIGIGSLTLMRRRRRPV